MPRPAGPPTVRLRRLAAELKALRAEAQLTREQVEEQTGVNQGTLWRIEKGQAKPHNGTLETLFDLYGVAESRRTELIELTRGAKDPGWLGQFKDALLKEVMPEVYAAYIGFETEAKTMNTYESSFVPGLLQTEEYARAVMIDGWPMEADAVERGAHPGMSGAFTCFKFGTLAPDIVHTESLAGALFLELQADVERFGLAFDHMRAMALSPRDTGTFVATLMAD